MPDLPDLEISKLPSIDAVNKDTDYLVISKESTAFASGYGSFKATPSQLMQSVSTSNLSDLGDVTIASPEDGQLLKYNATTHKWVNATGGDGGDVTKAYVDEQNAIQDAEIALKMGQPLYLIVSESGENPEIQDFSGKTYVFSELREIIDTKCEVILLFRGYHNMYLCRSSNITTPNTLAWRTYVPAFTVAAYPAIVTITLNSDNQSSLTTLEFDVTKAYVDEQNQLQDAVISNKANKTIYLNYDEPSNKIKNAAGEVVTFAQIKEMLESADVKVLQDNRILDLSYNLYSIIGWRTPVISTGGDYGEVFEVKIFMDDDVSTLSDKYATTSYVDSQNAAQDIAIAAKATAPVHLNVYGSNTEPHISGPTGGDATFAELYALVQKSQVYLQFHGKYAMYLSQYIPGAFLQWETHIPAGEILDINYPARLVISIDPGNHVSQTVYAETTPTGVKYALTDSTQSDWTELEKKAAQERLGVVVITQEEYDLLEVKGENTIYIIT